MLTVILTGGASRRMGRDKATLRIDGRGMLETLIERFGGEGDEVAVSVNRLGRFNTFGAPELPDEYPGLGPLNGLISAFTRTGAERIFLTATDIPRGDKTLARRLFELSEGYDACVIRRAEGGLEPLFAVYSRACLEPARRSVEAGRLSFEGLLKQLSVRYVDEAELPEWELQDVLRNVNTVEEYSKIKGLED